MYKTLLALALVAAARAACPNSCSGHGSCGNDDICYCYQDWLNGDEDGGDCSKRECPYEIAWVDTPSDKDVAHALAECAGRGICNRDTGDCECFDGFTGKGCRRTTCPNDCSGHGTCEYIKELRNDLGDNYKHTGDAPSTDQYAFEFPLMWDYHKTRACVCDPKWTDIDCSRRMCPKGNYALYNNAMPVSETQLVRVMDWSSEYDEFALTFRSTLNEEFTTYTLHASNLTYLQVEDALNSLPNKIIEDVDVMINRTVFAGDSKGPGVAGRDWVNIYITFAGTMTTGDQYALECRTNVCADGCQPKIANSIEIVGGTCSVTNDETPAVETNRECSTRGHCDYDTGVCDCFEGYTDEFCSTQTALI